MKKIGIVLLLFIAVGSLAGCGQMGEQDFANNFIKRYVYQDKSIDLKGSFDESATNKKSSVLKNTLSSVDESNKKLVKTLKELQATEVKVLKEKTKYEVSKVEKKSKSLVVTYKIKGLDLEPVATSAQNEFTKNMNSYKTKDNTELQKKFYSLLISKMKKVKTFNKEQTAKITFKLTKANKYYLDSDGAEDFQKVATVFLFGKSATNVS